MTVKPMVTRKESNDIRLFYERMPVFADGEEYDFRIFDGSFHRNWRTDLLVLAAEVERCHRELGLK